LAFPLSAQTDDSHAELARNDHHGDPVAVTNFRIRKSRTTVNNADPFLLRVQLFFLGAGFLLVETKAVVTMALLFGSTWIVNSVVFLAVLLMILLANLWTARFSPNRLWPYYVGLMISLLLNCMIPLDFFLGMSRVVQVVAACALVFAPILFAAVIFASVFKRTGEPDQALGINIAGAMVGGLAEYSSMLLGFQYLVLVAFGFYIVSSLGLKRPVRITQLQNLSEATDMHNQAPDAR
jgi:hypothetical protein